MEYTLSARDFFCDLLFVLCLCAAFRRVRLQRLCELVGAGSILLAADALEQRDDFVGGAPLDQAADPLQVAAAAADELDIVNGIVLADVKDDLFGTRSLG